jgi:hypothetical protein
MLEDMKKFFALSLTVLLAACGSQTDTFGGPEYCECVFVGQTDACMTPSETLKCSCLPEVWPVGCERHIIIDETTACCFKEI